MCRDDNMYSKAGKVRLGLVEEGLEGWTETPGLH